jgi:hypothetical protein
MNWQGCGRKRPLPNQDIYYSVIFSEAQNKTTKTMNMAGHKAEIELSTSLRQPDQYVFILGENCWIFVLWGLRQ